MWDTTGKNQVPLHNHNKLWAIYFFLFFFFTNIVIITLFIGIFVEKYIYLSLKASKFRKNFCVLIVCLLENFHILSDQQREWAHIRKSIMKMKPLVLVKYNTRKKFYCFFRKQVLKTSFWTRFLCFKRSKKFNTFSIFVLFSTRLCSCSIG